MNADAVLEREYLKARAKILELGAILDRIDRAGGDVQDDRRLTLLRQGIGILHKDGTSRAEQIQMLYSLPFQDEWRRQFELE